jgi:hypothetical protein
MRQVRVIVLPMFVRSAWTTVPLGVRPSVRAVSEHTIRAEGHMGQVAAGRDT